MSRYLALVLLLSVSVCFAAVVPNAALVQGTNAESTNLFTLQATDDLESAGLESQSDSAVKIRQPRKAIIHKLLAKFGKPVYNDYYSYSHHHYPQPYNFGYNKVLGHLHQIKSFHKAPVYSGYGQPYYY